ncbi:MAG: hypothetical protein PHQ43_14730 [Dehalococcoidales bacterium]|nr:hypothetical protein [Dehalococcoidales bacterium]
MTASGDRKKEYVDKILKRHPIYLPETFISQQAAKRLQKLPEQTIFWLWHLADRTECSAEQALMQAQGFVNLWACRETIHDGENEYGCEFLIRAESEDEALAKAWHYVIDNYSYDGHEQSKPYTEFLNEDNAFEISGDYRIVEAEVCRQITSVKELLDFIGVYEMKGVNCAKVSEPVSGE